MSIKRILRFYLVFTLIITAAAALSYNKKINSEFTRYYASVVHSLDEIANNGDFKYLDQNFKDSLETLSSKCVIVNPSIL